MEIAGKKMNKKNKEQEEGIIDLLKWSFFILGLLLLYPIERIKDLFKGK